MAAKYEKLEMLKAMLEEWLPFKAEDDPLIVDLKQRIKSTDTQLQNMRP
jgi:hypothetical protein